MTPDRPPSPSNAARGPRRDVRSATGWSMVAMLFGQAFQVLAVIGGGVLLARLLTPRDYGLVAMATAVIGFGSMVKDFGIPLAVVQNRDIDDRELTGLFWTNLLWNVGLLALMAAAAPAAAWFFGEDTVLAVVLILAGVTFLSSLVNVHVGLLRREMRFGEIASIEAGSLTAGIAVGIVLAWRGAGYWALVAQQAAHFTIQTTMIALRCRWRPGGPFLRASAAGRRMRKFARSIAGTKVLGFVSRDAHHFIIGGALGANALGLYTNALRWSMLPVRELHLPMQNVAVSALSRMQDEPARFRKYFRTMAMGFAAATLPTLTFVMIEGNRLVVVVLGEQWTEAGPLMRALALAAAGMALTRLMKWVYLAEGRASAYLAWSAFVVPVSIAAVGVGVVWGTLGVALGYAAAMCLLGPISIWCCCRGSPVIRVRDLVATYATPAVMAAGGAIALYAKHALAAPLADPALDLLAAAAVFGVGAAGVCFATPSGRRTVVEVVETLVRRRRAAPASTGVPTPAAVAPTPAGAGNE